MTGGFAHLSAGFHSYKCRWLCILYTATIAQLDRGCLCIGRKLMVRQYAFQFGRIVSYIKYIVRSAQRACAAAKSRFTRRPTPPPAGAGRQRRRFFAQFGFILSSESCKFIVLIRGLGLSLTQPRAYRYPVFWRNIAVHAKCYPKQIKVLMLLQGRHSSRLYFRWCQGYLSPHPSSFR